MVLPSLPSLPLLTGLFLCFVTRTLLLHQPPAAHSAAGLGRANFLDMMSVFGRALAGFVLYCHHLGTPSNG